MSYTNYDALYNFKLYYPNKNVEVIDQIYVGDGETVFTLSDGNKVLFDELTCGFMRIRPNETGELLDEDWRKEFKRRLRKKILFSRKSQKDIAEAIGISTNTMSNYVNGRRIPDARIIDRLARVLNCTANDLTNFDYLL